MRAILSFALLSMIACDGGLHPPDGPPKRDAALDAYEPDAPPDAFIPPCLTTGTYNVDSTWPFTTGPFAIIGTITLPASVPSGRFVQLETVGSGANSGNFLKSQALAAATSAVTYRTRTLPDGSWKICLKVDVDGNQSVGDIGVDYAGCYDGTVAAPIATSASATPVVLGGDCQSNVDFGIGLQ